MARKTNKTDHVLNLLSSGGKKASPKKDDNDTPPVDLKPKKPNIQAEPDEGQPPAETDVAENAAAAEAEPSAEAASGRAGAGEEALPDVKTTQGLDEDSPQKTAGAQNPSGTDKLEQAKAETKTIAVPSAETPTISVVHTSGEENPIADAVKNSLEAELDAYMEQKKQPHQQEKEKKTAKPEPRAEKSINVSELLGAADEEEKTPAPSDTAAEMPGEAHVTAESQPAGAMPESAPDAVSGGTSVDEQQPDGGKLETGIVAAPQADAIEPQAVPDAIETPAAGSNASEPSADARMNAVESAPEPVVAEGTPPETDAVPEPQDEATEAAADTSAAERTLDEPGAGHAEMPPDPAETEQGAPESAPEQQADAPEPSMLATAGPQAAEAGNEQGAAEKDYMILNVMEHLVRDQVPKYVRQFGHCDCDRCIEDTIALTLTHLPAKYVVIDKHAVSPMLSFYEKRYAGQLIVEITKATMIVNGSPKH